MRKKVLFICIGILSMILIGCSGTPSNEDILNDVAKASGEVESYRLIFKEEENGLKSEGEIEVNKLKKEYRTAIEGETETEFYGNEDVFIFKQNGVVEDLTDERDTFNTEKLLEFFHNPVKTFQANDENLADHITIDSEDDEERTIEYVGDEEDETVLDEFARAYLKMTMGESAKWNIDKVSLEDFALKMAVDKETNLLNSVTIETAFSENGQEKKMKQTYAYQDYDKVKDIEALEVAETTPPTTTGEKEDEEVVGNAGKYVEALIYATIFQDVDKYVKHAPKQDQEDVNEKEGKIQKTEFRETYVQNTKNNMVGLNVSDKQIEDLADAVMGALSKTKFEIVSAASQQANQVTVKVSIEGFSDKIIYDETEKELGKVIAEHPEMTQDEIIEKNLEILIDQYKDITLLDPIEVEVDVLISNGSFLVPTQDQFLYGFVQQ